MNNNIQSSKAIAVANRRHLASVCAAKGLARKAHEQSPFRFIIVNANKEHVGVIGLRHLGGWCIVTTPKRRHKEMNFASATAAIIAQRLNIPFYDNVISAKNRQRINPVFKLEYTFEEPNVIVFDDILTTGSTLGACRQVLADKNCVFIVGINNN
jgi:pyrimidine operon attenuation protein/uracil phosphoribosyltransferase